MELLRVLIQTGFLDLRAFPPGRGPSVAERVRVGDTTQIERFVERYADRNLYVGVAERVTDENGKLSNCGLLRALFVDIDFKDYNGNEQAAAEKLLKFPIMPSIVVESGGGLQCYWVLTEPIDLRQDAEGAKTLLRRLATAVGGDLRAAEPARILRIPGTRNFKYTPPRTVNMRFTDERVSLSSLTAALDAVPDARVAKRKTRSGVQPTSDGPTRLDQARAWAETQPAAIQGEGGDTHTFFICCAVVRGFDLTVDDAFAALHDWNARCTPPWADSDLRTKIANANEYGDEPRGGRLRDKFVVYKSGSREGLIVADSQHNVRLALKKLSLELRHNAFADITLARYDGQVGPVDDALLNRVWLVIDERFHFRPPMEFFQIVVDDLARRNSFHPVRDYLDGLSWDGEPRIDRWLTTYGRADDSAYTRAVGSLFLVAAVRRVRVPGSKFDELLILESKQGRLKSQALRALCPHDDWFSDDLPLGVDAKQIIERTAGKWILEAAELHGSSNAELDRLKAMLARQVDGPVRLAYGRKSVQVARQFVAAGTTNKVTEYLRDSTGNRRFWPVAIDRFDVDAIRRDRDQLWAEAAHREATGASIRLPEELWEAAAIEQDARRQIDPWEELLDDQIDFTRDAILVEELWFGLRGAGHYFKRNDAERLAQILQRRGFTRKKKVDKVVVDGNGTEKDPVRAWAWVRDGQDPASVKVTVQQVPVAPSGAMF